jgi:hypothetical protein
MGREVGNTFDGALENGLSCLIDFLYQPHRLFHLGGREMSLNVVDCIDIYLADGTIKCGSHI